MYVDFDVYPPFKLFMWNFLRIIKIFIKYIFLFDYLLSTLLSEYIYINYLKISI